MSTNYYWTFLFLYYLEKVSFIMMKNMKEGRSFRNSEKSKFEKYSVKHFIMWGDIEGVRRVSK
jgi:hypothetical protein